MVEIEIWSILDDDDDDDDDDELCIEKISLYSQKSWIIERICYFQRDIKRDKKEKSNVMEYDHTSLKRHLFINKFLYISFLIWGSWNSFPVVLSILVHFGSKRSWDGWFFMVVILLNRNWSLSSLKVHILKSAWVVHCIYNTKHL